jgi:hypothetical protein
MDVQAAAPTGSSGTITFPPPAPAPADSGAPPAPVATAPSLPPSSGNNGYGTGGSIPAPPAPAVALLPPGGGSSNTSKAPSESLPGNVGKLYAAPANTTSVSFEPAAGSNEIVTVVTNTQTGKVIVQFPSETLIALAQFFQKLDNSAGSNGAVVDKKV